jgi:uroporphyrinogen-III decarboxylase
LLESHIEQAMDNAASNPQKWRSMLDFVVDGCADALDHLLVQEQEYQLLRSWTGEGAWSG